MVMSIDDLRSELGTVTPAMRAARLSIAFASDDDVTVPSSLRRSSIHITIAVLRSLCVWRLCQDVRPRAGAASRDFPALLVARDLIASPLEEIDRGFSGQAESIACPLLFEPDSARRSCCWC